MSRSSTLRRAVGSPRRRRTAAAVVVVPLAAAGLAACIPTLPLTVNTTVDAHDANPGDGLCQRIGNLAQCSLRAAIDEVNAAAGVAYKIDIPPGTYTTTLAGANEDLNVGGDFDIRPGKVAHLNGTGAGVIIAGGGTERVFDNFSVLGFTNLTVRGGASSQGAGIRSGGLWLVLDQTTVRANVSTGTGGGIASTAGKTLVISSTIEGNSAQVGGGGIHLSGGAELDARNSTISGNVADPTPAIPDAPLTSNIEDLGDLGVVGEVSVPSGDAIQAATDPSGAVPVIIEFDAPAVPETALDEAAAGRQRSELASRRDELVERLPGGAASVRRTYETVPMVATTVSAGDIDSLATTPGVKKVHIDELSAPTLDQSVPWINGDEARAVGADGTGQLVAVIDTGIDNDHILLAGTVAVEACFAQGDTFGDGVGDCPNGLPTMTGADSGENCSWLTLGCYHGTHVGSTAAGSTLASYISVAPSGDLGSFNVFSRLTTEAKCGTGVLECVRSYTSDQIGALDWIYANRASYPFASVNMSLGGGQFFAACDGDSRASVISNLRAAGIATVISSGNSSYTTSVGAPGCISAAITVGASGNASDTVASFSNGAPMVDVLAPGVSINAAYPGDLVASLNGTSMAAPHVAGAFAALRTSFPAATVTQIEAALETTGVPIIDTRVGAGNLVKPRIDVMAAVTALGGPGYGGGIANIGGTMTLESVTITANSASWGGGIYNTGSATTSASAIVSQARGKDCALPSGTLLSSGRNADSDGTCGLVGAGDVSSISPLLGVLANNGGNTSTHLPAAGSPLVNAIPLSTGVCAIGEVADQRGTARPQGAACDIGSVER